MKKVGLMFAILFVLACWSPVDATVIFSTSDFSYTFGNTLPNPPFCAYECYSGRTGDPSVGLAKNPSECDPGVSAPSGGTCFHWPVDADSGTSSAVGTGYLRDTDGGKIWTADYWQGYFLYDGDIHWKITGNSACPGTCQLDLINPDPNSQVETPASGNYRINIPDLYNEVKNSGGIDHTVSEGDVLYFGVQFNIARRGGADVFRRGTTVQSASKGLEAHGDDSDDFRWGPSLGQWDNMAANASGKYSVWFGNPTNHFNKGTGCGPDIEESDIILPNKGSYSASNPPQLDYDKYHNLVYVIKFSDCSPLNGYVRLYWNGTEILEYGITSSALQTANTFSGSNIILDWIEAFGTFCQGDYDCPPFDLYVGKMVVGTAASDVSEFMSDPDPTTATAVISNNTTGSPVGTFTGTEDTWVQQENPNMNRGDKSVFDVAKYGAENHGHALLKFSGLSNIPSDATITSVTVGLWLETNGGGTHTIDLRRALRAWDENQATWNIYSTGNNWTTGGGLSAGNDRVSTVSGSITGVGSTQQYYTVTQTSGGLVDDIQGWVDGTLANNGWHLERNGAGEDATYKQFGSKDGDNGHRPYVSVTYSVPTSNTVVISNNTTGSPVGNIAGTEDTWLQEDNPTTNRGSSSLLDIAKYGAGSHGHALLKFSGLSGIPSNAIVTSVTLGLWLETDGGGTHTVDLRRALRSWAENQATWNIYSTGNNWTTGGGLNAGNDRVNTVSGSFTNVGSTLQYYTITQTSGGLLDDVQGWIDGTVANNGWHLERNGSGEDSTYKDFASKDGTNGHRPYLSITYYLD